MAKTTKAKAARMAAPVATPAAAPAKSGSTTSPKPAKPEKAKAPATRPSAIELPVAKASTSKAPTPKGAAPKVAPAKPEVAAKKAPELKAAVKSKAKAALTTSPIPAELASIPAPAPVKASAPARAPAARSAAQKASTARAKTETPAQKPATSKSASTPRPKAAAKAEPVAAPVPPKAEIRPESAKPEAKADTGKSEAKAPEPQARSASGTAGGKPGAGAEGPDAGFFAYLVRDPEAFARNAARILEGAGKAAAAYLRPREAGLKSTLSGDEFVGVFKTLAHVGEYWMAEPSRTFDAQARLWTGYMDIWNRTLKGMSGESVEPAIRPDPRDKRFQDPEWSQNQFFSFIKQMYLMTTKWADGLVEGAAGIDERTRLKAEFYVRQIADAVSPSNFVMTNPELLRETLANNGENLVRGMQMLAEDIAAGGGDLKIRQTSSGNFQIGVNLATTPGKVIYQNDVCQVLQYEPSTQEVYKRPLLIVPPWINKFYILDLNADKSFIKWAVDQGHTVFVISWINPDERQADKSFEEYMKEGILTAVDTIEKATGEREVDAIGYCVGGTLLAVTLAWCAATGDDRIRSATFLTTQVDFANAGGLLAFVDEEQVQLIEASMKLRGYLEGQKMAASFNMLRPNDLIWPYFVNNYMRGREPFPFDLLYWNADATRMPAANHSFYLRNCYLDNKLSRGLVEIGGVKLDLGKVTIPVYNLATREDHIAPAKSVFVGSGCFGGPVDYVMSGSGHIAGVVNPPAKGKYQYWTGGKPVGTFEDWVAGATETPGSWWPHWEAWLVARSDGAKVPARTPGGGRLNAIEDAPGSYVKVKG